MDKIKLHSRYGIKNYLEKINNNSYKFITESPYRIGTSKDNEVIFIDPSGGPMMSVGYEVEEIGKVVKSISLKDDSIIINFNEDK